MCCTSHQRPLCTHVHMCTALHLRVPRVGLEDDLELRVPLHAVRVCAVTGVVGAKARLRVADAPRLGAEDAEEGGRVHGARADLQRHAACCGPRVHATHEAMLRLCGMYVAEPRSVGTTQH